MSSTEHVQDDFTPIQFPRPRRKPRLHPRLLANWLYLLITRVLFFVGLAVVSRSLWSMLTRLKSETTPIMFNRYRALYQNQTLDSVSDRSTVVQPLIGQDQHFDIGVTIWTVATEEEEKEWRESVGQNFSKGWFPALVDGPTFIGSFSPPWHEFKSSLQLSPYLQFTGDPLFKIIYSDIAFRQIQLSDIRSTTVNFSIPKKYLRSGQGRQEHTIDLKAAFTIIPSSPLLDSIKTSSSWIHPDGLTPKRAWPFPLGSQVKGSRTILDDAVDRLSFVIPLVKMFQAPNPCFNASQIRGSPDTQPFTLLPHIVSRTHIRIVKDLGIMNFNLFNESHNALKLHECGKSEELRDLGLPPDLTNNAKQVIVCQRDYRTTGILETLFEMDVALDDGSNRTEWAYAPYFESSKRGLGPKDFTPVPTQHNCSRHSNTTNWSNATTIDDDELPEALDISWKLTYSAVSPFERTMLDSLNLLMAPDGDAFNAGGNATEYTQIMAQDQVDQANSLFGVHREDSAHPRRRLIFTFLSTTLSVVATAFDVLYWYTRSGTAFISVSGTILLALANLIDSEIIIQGRDAWSSFRLLLPLSNEDPFFWRFGHDEGRSQQMYSVLRLLRFCFVVFLPLQSVWMSMTALRVEFGWPESGAGDTFFRRNIPTVRRMPPTHRERASERLEKSTLQWKTRIAIVAGLFVAYHAMLPHVPKLVTELHPEPDPSIVKAKMLYKNMIMKQSIVDPLFVSGCLFQLILNNSSGFFAGSYKIAAILKVIVLSFDILQFIPSMVGLPASRGGVDANFVMYAAVIAVEGWQATTLPRAPTDDDHEEQE